MSVSPLPTSEERQRTLVDGALGLFTNKVDGVFQGSVIRGATEVVEAAGLELVIHELTQPPRRPGSVLELAGGTRGSLVLANVLSDAALTGLVGSGHAVTLVSHRAPGLDAPAVLHDNRQGMRQLVEHLVADGRRGFVYVGGHLGQLDGRERQRAFEEELMRHSLTAPADHFLRGDFEPELAAASTREFLAKRPAFDAVVVADYLMAIAVCEVVRRAGLQIPEDVSVVAFGDGPEAAAAGLTVVGADVVELGRRSARQLLAQVRGERVRGFTLIRTRLMVRES